MALKAFADAVVVAREAGAPFLDRRIPDADTAYLIQDEVASRVCRQRNTAVAGYKIGLTNEASREALGSTTSVSGRLFLDRVRLCPGAIVLDRVNSPIVELEICLRLSCDVEADTPIEQSSAERIVDAAFMAIEIVDNGGADLRNAHLPSMISSNAWGHSAVLGARMDVASLVDPVHASSIKNGHAHTSATSEAVVGGPMSSLRWLAAHLARRGLSLKRGDLVMTGAIINLGAISPGDTIRFELGDAAMMLRYSADAAVMDIEGS